MIGAKLGAGREADVHAWGDDAVVKLYRPGFGGHRAEALALRVLDGLPDGDRCRRSTAPDRGGRAG